MSIQFGDYALNKTRVEKLVSSNTKKEALKMGFFDKFKDLFRNVKKAEILTRLYDELQIQDSHEQKKVDQNTNVDKIIIFNRLRLLADEDSQDQFSVEVKLTSAGYPDKLTFLIGETSIFKIKAKPLDHYISTRFNNNLTRLADPDKIEAAEVELRNLARLTATSLSPANNARGLTKIFNATMERFVLSRTALNPEPYTILRSYKNEELTDEQIKQFDDKLTAAQSTANNLDEFIENIPESYANCTTQAIYAGSQLIKQGYDVAIHDMAVTGAPHTFCLVRSSNGVFVCDPWTGVSEIIGSNDEILDIKQIPEKFQEIVLKKLNLLSFYGKTPDDKAGLGNIVWQGYGYSISQVLFKRAEELIQSSIQHEIVK